MASHVGMYNKSCLITFVPMIDVGVGTVASFPILAISAAADKAVLGRCLLASLELITLPAVDRETVISSRKEVMGAVYRLYGAKAAKQAVNGMLLVDAMAVDANELEFCPSVNKGNAEGFDGLMSKTFRSRRSPLEAGAGIISAFELAM